MNNSGYTPYMFGSSYGMAANTSNNMPNNVYAGQATRRDHFNVRDCMYWPASLGDSRQAPRFNGAMNQGSYPMAPNTQYTSFNRGDQYFSPAVSMPMTGGFGSNDPYTFHTGATGEPTQGQQQVPQAPVKAFISTGEGGAQGKPIQIPCHMGMGPGNIPQVTPMPAMGYKVSVPPNPPSAPVDFEIGQK